MTPAPEGEQRESLSAKPVLHEVSVATPPDHAVFDTHPLLA